MHLLIGLMFFYGIEQLFFNDILHDSAARGVATLGYIVAVMVCDIPAGLLADRFGRKRSLLIGCWTLVLTLVVLGASHNIWTYVLGSALYGVYTAFYNGAAQALLYDYLKETGDTENYARYQGQNYALFLAGAAIANFCSGFIAEAFDLRAAYFACLIPAVLAIATVWGIREPRHTESETAASLPFAQSLKQVGREVRARPRILLFALQFTMLQTFLLTIGEFGQAYILSFGYSAVALGVLWSIDAIFSAVAQLNAHRFRSRPRLWVGLFCVLLGIFMMIHSKIGIGIFWLLYGLAEALTTVAEAEVQAETSSTVRATMLSTVGFASNLIGIPALVLFTTVYKHHDVFVANTVLVIVIGITLVLTLLVRPPVAKPTKEAPHAPPLIS